MSHLNELDAMFMDITRACKVIGYGRMMQIISDAWRAELKSKYGTDTGAFEGTPVGAYAAALARVERLEKVAREAQAALRLSVSDWRETDKMLFPEVYQPQVEALAKLDAALEAK